MHLQSDEDVLTSWFPRLIHYMGDDRPYAFLRSFKMSTDLDCLLTKDDTAVPPQGKFDNTSRDRNTLLKSAK